jgi:hypothetical protein
MWKNLLAALLLGMLVSFLATIAMGPPALLAISRLAQSVSGNSYSVYVRLNEGLVFAAPVTAGFGCALVQYRYLYYRRIQSRFPPSCSQCGYSLRGLTTRRCPECGHPYDERVFSAGSNLQQPACTAPPGILVILLAVGAVAILAFFVGPSALRMWFWSQILVPFPLRVVLRACEAAVAAGVCGLCAVGACVLLQWTSKA